MSVKKEPSNSGTSSDPIGESEFEDLTLFSVVECSVHGYHVLMWTATLDPEGE
jgi:hypothetical protein